MAKVKQAWPYVSSWQPIKGNFCKGCMSKHHYVKSWEWVALSGSMMLVCVSFLSNSEKKSCVCVCCDHSVRLLTCRCIYLRQSSRQDSLSCIKYIAEIWALSTTNQFNFTALSSPQSSTSGILLLSITWIAVDFRICHGIKPSENILFYPRRRDFSLKDISTWASRNFHT